MNQHAYEVKIGKKSLNDFLKVYGHVRPGNYDIQSKSFNENIEFVKDIIDSSNCRFKVKLEIIHTPKFQTFLKFPRFKTMQKCG